MLEIQTACGPVKMDFDSEEKLKSVDLPAGFPHNAYTYPHEYDHPLVHWYHAFLDVVHPPQHIPWDELRKMLNPDWSAKAENFYKTLYEVPWGKTITYGELAQKTNSGARAVGNWCARNPYPLLIPCHRVLPHTGKVGNYQLGPDAKAHLLHREGVQIASKN